MNGSVQLLAPYMTIVRIKPFISCHCGSKWVHHYITEHLLIVNGERNTQRFQDDSKHAIYVTPIDKYSLKQLLFKIPVGYNFILVIYLG